jgi:hypothetical protein
MAKVVQADPTEPGALRDRPESVRVVVRIRRRAIAPLAHKIVVVPGDPKREASLDLVRAVATKPIGHERGTLECDVALLQRPVRGPRYGAGDR